MMPDPDAVTFEGQSPCRPGARKRPIVSPAAPTVDMVGEDRSIANDHAEPRYGAAPNGAVAAADCESGGIFLIASNLRHGDCLFPKW